MSEMLNNKCSANGCTKKVGLVSFMCRCEKKYCNKHRMPETHNCQYDYKTNGKLKLEQENKRIVFEKIISI